MGGDKTLSCDNKVDTAIYRTGGQQPAFKTIVNGCVVNNYHY